MPTLASDLRKVLENAVVAARDQATTAATAALNRLAVAPKDFPSYLTPDERALRIKLRAAARQLGDPWNADKQAFASLTKLTHEVAYEHWHRMLFARFLAENNLLMHPEHGVHVDLATVAELAQEEATKTGAKADTWAMAGRFAAGMLPSIFRPDDPALAVQLAPEHQQALEKILESLPATVFVADDALGWVYQFWQSAEKERVNNGVKAGDKITGQTLPAVTQLFTEHYMVLFLLHNTVGAWWAGKKIVASGPLSVASEEEARQAVALPGVEWEYLRFVRGTDGTDGPWRPAAGTFDGWPKSAKELKLLDPCSGSGHFLVAGFELLVRLRMAEEGLSPKDAALAVIADNLFGLELDARCTQIAAFNVALAAWKLAGEHFPIPDLHIACSGLAPSASLEQWQKLADKNSAAWAGIPAHARPAVTYALSALHHLFGQAPELGSLIDPADAGAGAELLGAAADWETIQPFLASAMQSQKDDDAHERAVAARGMARAAEILSGQYTLVVTNVPYLGRGGQGPAIKTFCEKNYPEAKSDLATVFVARILRWLGQGGTTAVVTPQNWLFLTSYKKLREQLLRERTWNMVARLGPGAFETIGGHVVNVALITLSQGKPAKDVFMAGIEASGGKTPTQKAALLRGEAAPEVRYPAQSPVEAGNRGSGAAQTVAHAPPAYAHGSPTYAHGSPTYAHGSPTYAHGSPTYAHEPPTYAHGSPTVAHGSQTVAGAAQTTVGDADSTGPEADGPESGTGSGEPELSDPADGSVRVVQQAEQLKNPDARVVLELRRAEFLLSSVAQGVHGLGSKDTPYFFRQFWELPGLDTSWELMQTTVENTTAFGGMEQAVFWENGEGILHERGSRGEAILAGRMAWSKEGVLISQTGALAASRYVGDIFDKNAAVILPNDPSLVPAIWCLCSSGEFAETVRRIDQSLKVTNQSLVKIPFDLPHWQKVAAQKYPNGLPEPQSDDPTQWLFHGHPAGRVPLTADPNPHLATVLQVAVARLVGYRWPAELDDTMRLAPEARAWVQECKALEDFADDDGVVPLVAINKEPPGAQRVRALLEAAFGPRWTPGLLNDLIAAAAQGGGKGGAGQSLDEWLTGGDFWAQHCAVFHQRPFIWQIWDGKKDGFNILVNYHCLAEDDGKGKKLLEKIVYTYLGDWITQQQAASKQGVAGADLRLKAAQDLQKNLEAILAGEPPYDLFVRWKPLHEQPIGWQPDINDGVRINIRPFVTAGVLRGKVNVKWTKDRGKEPQSIRPKEQFPWFWSCPEDDKAGPPVDFAGGAAFTGERLNNLHYTNRARQAAREKARQDAGRSTKA